jgi:2-polyprenyl-3-methyl-5-hydroxy-6-metoxy-1,4-benzoquinol methylase
MSDEISGDSRLTIAQRLRYLALNLGRNVKPGKCTTQRLRFCAGRLPRTPSTASPGRALTEAFLHSHLPKLLPPGKLRVLEIGCGSGSLTRLLSEEGYSGSYVGVDISDRFDRTAQTGFQKDFVQVDAHRFKPDGQFDLVISVSALEHIPEDRRLIGQLAGYVAPGGLQVHFVPSGWGLLTYLWHGYRQYSAVSLDERFDSQRASIFSMGGAASFTLHFLFITVGEILLRLRLRQRLPRLYSWMLDGCLQLDRLAPVCGTMYAVCQTTASTSN